MRQPEPSTRSRPRNRAVRVLLAACSSAILIGATFGPIAIAAPKSAHWSTSHNRAMTVDRVSSIRAAARLAAAHPRTETTKKRPVLRAPLTATSRPSRAIAAGATSPKAATPRIVLPPDLSVAQTLTGLDEATSGGLRPPDPWVSVNSTYVVQVVNSLIRISSRSGAPIVSVPTWAFFALPGGLTASDARVLWDAVHARWVAVAISFDGPLANNFVNLAISDGADPTAGWATYSIYYGDFLPDYPSISTSSDKIVITDDIFDPTFAFDGAELNTFTWASILSGTSIVYNECFDTSYIHARAAQVLSPSNDVHLIMEDALSGEQWYYRMTASGNCAAGAITDGTDLSSLAPFALPPDPREAPGDTIGTNNQAIDERPTDAIWQNGKLWWVSTFPITYDAGITFNDGVVLWNATTATIGAPTAGTPIPISAGDGIDDFMGGIGLMRNGTLVTIYSESSNADFASMESAQVPPGGSLSIPLHLDDGDATYGGDRWGDYAGVATDPVGTGSVWATHEVAAADGTWRTDVFRLVGDTDLPGLPGAPATSLLIPTTLTPSVPVRISWTTATDVGTNVARYELAQSIDSGPFVQVGSLAGLTTLRQLLFGHVYQFAVRAVDAVGNAGAWNLSTTRIPYLYQSTSSTVYTTGWGSSTSSAFSGGSTKYSSTAGKYATFTATNARSISIVATKAASRGSFKVYVDGVYKGAISTYSTTTKYRQLVYQFSWAVPGTHKVKVVVSGTSGHPRVDLDAFVVLR
jgi:hypothetical protein